MNSAAKQRTFITSVLGDALLFNPTKVWLVVWLVVLLLSEFSRPVLAQQVQQLLTDRELSITPDPNAPGVSEVMAQWVRKNHQPIRSLTAERYDDLQFLKPLLQGKRIVQLGESSHGVAEFNLVKARLVKFLHQELGYEVIAFESPLDQCYRADRQAGGASPTNALMDCLVGVWHTKEVLPLFEYIQASKKTARPLTLAGFDIQQIGRGKRSRPAFLRDVVTKLDAAYAGEIYQLDTDFLTEYDKGRQSFQPYLQRDGARLIAAYDRLAGFLAQHQTRLVGLSKENPQAPLVARQTARYLSLYLKQQTASDAAARSELRDQGMAENLEFLLQELYPGKKIIVWGHNFHLQHDNAAIPPLPAVFPGVRVHSMGHWLAQRHRQELYTIGVFMHQGRAANNARQVYEITPVQRGSLEAILAQAGRKSLFLDLSQPKQNPATEWMYQPATAKYNGTHDMTMVLRAQYDGVLFIHTVTPPIYLY
jgi:erythromycin esterase